MAANAFNVDSFLAQPLTARVATNGPTVRPTWFLWEDGAFWILTGPWSRLLARAGADPAIALVVDVCDLATGLVRQVIARGTAEILPFDVPRGRRKLTRYLGADEASVVDPANEREREDEVAAEGLTPEFRPIHGD